MNTVLKSGTPQETLPAKEFAQAVMEAVRDKIQNPMRFGTFNLAIHFYGGHPVRFETGESKSYQLGDIR
jgi:hypothetical protein